MKKKTLKREKAVMQDRKEWQEFKKKILYGPIIFEMWVIFPTDATRSFLVLYFIDHKLSLPSWFCHRRH